MSELQPGDRVRGCWDLATVLDVLDNQRILVQFDAVDATGWRSAPQFWEPVIRHASTLTKMPRDTPSIEECDESKRGRQ